MIVLPLALDRLTTKFALIVLPVLPSLTETFANVVVVGGSSLSVIDVETPVGPEMVAPLAPERLTEKVSLTSSVESFAIETVICFDAVSPELQVSVPGASVKSLPAVAVPPDAA